MLLELMCHLNKVKQIFSTQISNRYKVTFSHL